MEHIQITAAAVAEAIAMERERCARIAEEWLSQFGGHKPEYVDAQTWANDAVLDIAQAIRKPPVSTET